MTKLMKGYRWLTLYVDLYGDVLISCHMINNDGISPLICISQLVDGQQPHVPREHISTVRGRCEGRVPCDLRFRDIWVVVFDCNSNGEFSVDQSDHFRVDGSNDRHSWRERERGRESTKNGTSSTLSFASYGSLPFPTEHKLQIVLLFDSHCTVRVAESDWLVNTPASVRLFVASQ